MNSSQRMSCRFLLAMTICLVLAAGMTSCYIPEEPEGLGYEQIVPVPDASYPLPMIKNAANNSSSTTRYSIVDNPIAFALTGINAIWKGTTGNWQMNASIYTDEENGYEGGDGPGPDDYVTGSPIVDAVSWKANIDYVIKVTNERTDDLALQAFLDDRRSKNYSVIDGFGPLTGDYVAESGAYHEFTPMKLTDILTNSQFYPEDNDDVIYGGATTSTLGAMVQLAQDFRWTDASTSGSKYVFGTPRPWRMNDNGEIDFQDVVSRECYDAEGNLASHDGEDVFRIDEYETSVSVVPGLDCARRPHNPGKEVDSLNDDGSVQTVALYSPTTENRRKDSEYINIDVFDNNFYADHDEIKDLYEFRMTYGLPQTGTAGLDPVVPEAAELLLATRQPYLTAAQRRAVLATTEVDSGYPVLDGSNGWGRINLVAASYGYGAFDGDVYVEMDAGEGGFCAHDWWRNDISGQGKLTKSGSGKLTLTGNNSYNGGTVIQEGTLEAASSTAFGRGDVYMTGGTLRVTVPKKLKLRQYYTQKDGTLCLLIDKWKHGKLDISDYAIIEGGNLTIEFADGFTLRTGKRFKIMSAKRIVGTFSEVSAEGYTLDAEYTDHSVTIRVDGNDGQG